MEALSFLLIEAYRREIGNSERCDSFLYAKLVDEVLHFLSVHSVSSVVSDSV